LTILALIASISGFLNLNRRKAMGLSKEILNLLKLFSHLCVKCIVLGLTVSAVILGIVYFTQADIKPASAVIQESIDRFSDFADTSGGDVVSVKDVAETYDSGSIDIPDTTETDVSK
jgi:hypothetical protein